MTQQLYPLFEDLDAPEPYSDAQTMEIHHSKHHQTSTEKLNAALNNLEDLQSKRVKKLVRHLDAVPEAIHTVV